MFPTALIIATILPGIGPEPTSSAVREATLAELLSASWVGTWTREGETAEGAVLRRGVLTLPVNPPASMGLTIDEERDGYFRGMIGGRLPVVGTWKCERGRLVLCFAEASKGLRKF